MSGTNGIKFSVGAMAIYLALACYMMWNHDHNYALMFLIGALLWAISILIWHKVKEGDGNGSM